MTANRIVGNAAAAFNSPLYAGRMSFFAAGFLISVWAPLIPYARERAGIDGESTMGFLLLCLGAGSISAMSVAGSIASRLGCRRTIVGSILGSAIVLVGLASASSFSVLACFLLAFGVVLGILEVAMNINAVQVQNMLGRPIMSGFHSLYSIGCFVGAGGISILLSAGLSPLGATIPAVAIVGVLLAIWGRGFSGEADNEPTPFFVLPRGMVLVIGMLCFIMFIVEGSILDWSAILLSTFYGVDMSMAGVGYSVFAIAMTFSRLLGDRLVAMNKRAVIIVGSLMAAFGLLVVAFSNSAAFGFAGFAIIGLGAANIVPTLFVEATRQPEMSIQSSMAAVSLMGYTGALAGPAFIGFISSTVGLPVTFALLAVLVLAPAIMAKRILTARKT